MAMITARYAGRCAVCSTRIVPGQQIEYVKGQPPRHAACTPVQVPADAIHLSGGSGYGCQGWTRGETIPNPHPATRITVTRTFACPLCGPLPGNACGTGPQSEGHTAALVREERIETPGPGAGEPRFLTVLTAHRRYIREDGRSFGVGDEQGYVYEAACRAATPDEATPVQARLEARRLQREARVQLKALEQRFIDQGEYVEGQHRLGGERLDIGAGQDLSGGGAWFVVETEHIWHVLNNGRDGDNWSANNVRTGGAGAIGRRLPRTSTLETELVGLLAQAYPPRKERV